MTFDDSPIDYDDIMFHMLFFTYEYRSTKTVKFVLHILSYHKKRCIKGAFTSLTYSQGIYSIQNGAVNTEYVSRCFTDLAYNLFRLD